MHNVQLRLVHYKNSFEFESNIFALHKKNISSKNVFGPCHMYWIFYLVKKIYFRNFLNVAKSGYLMT